MKKVTLILLMTFVSSLSVIAQTAKTRRPALPSDISAIAGQDSDSLLKNPVITARMKRLLGDKYDSFMESFETLNPVTKEGNFLFSSGCLIHACTHLESAIAVDLVSRTIYLSIFRQDEKTRYFNEGGAATPKVIRDWANRLRRINQTNSSESMRSLAAPNIAAALDETSGHKRLHSLASVRGFIGGEAHDSYVVHARRGQLLMLRLYWQREGDNRASLAVSKSPDFYSGEQARFGAEYDKGQRWVGRIPETRDYYIYVVAHPSAHYTLKISVR
ncbi:MAG: hypothetical protein DMF68_15940 [Acidobacteria bacterium]|nr:MAG: hypothetical protein DMF68_15940 [Acidobacteriota bacterium]